MRYCVVGAGFSGAIIARQLADIGQKVLLIDERPHLAGNCHTERDPETGIMVHTYGPHIFHTKHKEVWDYINQYAKIQPFINRVKAQTQGRIYTLPINLLTINQFFGTCLRPDEAKEFLKEKADKTITNPKSFEEQALSMVGKELYEAFFKGYTRKQWGMDPTELPASILKRLPVRFDYDDNYYSDPYQGIPEEGYTPIIEKIVHHPNIEIRLSCSFESLNEEFDHVFYTGPIDRYFQFKFGRLEYRTLDFVKNVCDGDYQGNAVINYCEEKVPYTRVSEYKYFTPWEKDKFTKTIYFEEYSRLAKENDTQYYPIRLVNKMDKLQKYLELAKQEKGISFLGRLGTYRYLDMDAVIKESLEACRDLVVCLKDKKTIPVFFIDAV